MNPYFDQDFFGFWRLFFLGLFESRPLASDEIQLGCLLFIALSSTIVGLLLFLEKRTMIANSLSHTLLLGIVLAYLFWHALGGENEPSLFFMTIATFITAVITLFVIDGVEKRLRLDRNLANGFIFTSFFAFGILLVTLFTKSAHIGLETVMGNLDITGKEDLYFSFSVFVINLSLFFLFRKELVMVAFEPSFAQGIGISVPLFRGIMVLLTALTVTCSFRIAGVIMPLAFFTAPIVSARLFCHTLRSILLWASTIAGGVSLLAVSLSRHLLSTEGIALSTAGLAVTLLLFVLIVHILFFFCRRN